MPTTTNGLSSIFSCKMAFGCISSVPSSLVSSKHIGSLNTGSSVTWKSLKSSTLFLSTNRFKDTQYWPRQRNIQFNTLECTKAYIVELFEQCQCVISKSMATALAVNKKGFSLGRRAKMSLEGKGEWRFSIAKHWNLNIFPSSRILRKEFIKLSKICTFSAEIGR